VAIRTADVALTDFGFDLRPGAVPHDVGYRRALRRPISMIELQHDWIGLAAINARMQEQILDQST